MKMKAPKYVTVLTILNAMLRHISQSMPQIEQATRELGRSEIAVNARGGK
jgi:hypothetical protein